MLVIAFNQKRGIDIFRLSGRLTSDSSQELIDLIKDTQKRDKNYILDLSGLNFIDSVGLGSIIQVMKRVNSDGGELKLLNLINQPKVIFEITRVETIFEIYDNEDDAIASFGLSATGEDDERDNFYQPRAI